MTSRPIGVPWAVAGVAVLLIALAVAVPSSTAADESLLSETDDPHALELLTKSANANERVSYSGTRYVTAWSSLRTSTAAASAVVTVEHEVGGGTSLEVRDKREAVFLNASASPWLDDAGGSVALVAAAYHVRTRGAEYVAGRLTDVVEAVRGDGTVAAILWLDRTTALPLRRETFDVDGRMLSASAFIDVRITGTTTCCHVPDAVSATTLGRSEVAELRADGWTCPETLPGAFVLYDARRVGDVVHFAYSDGVMSLSIFQQSGALDHDHMSGETWDIDGAPVYVTPGPPARFTWESDGLVTTVVTDAPVDVVHALVKESSPVDQRAAADDGFFERLARGAKKVGSWLNPFD